MSMVLSWGKLACEEKSNEIIDIQKLFEMLEIHGYIVTIDAMGTQKEIILKSEKRFKGSITDKQFKCLLDSSYLDNIVNNWIYS